MSAQSVDAYLLFGRLAVKFGVLKPDGLRQTVEKQAQLAAKGKTFQVGEVAVRLKLMSDEQRQQILRSQATAPVKQEGSYFGYLALVNGFVKQKQLAEALKKQEAEGKKQKLGEIFKADKLMTDGQIDGVLRAQKRIRQRIARETQGKMEKAGGSSKAAEALAKLAQFEKQFGGMVEVVLESSDQMAAAVPPEADAMITDARPAPDALPLPVPPADIYTTMQAGELPVMEAESLPADAAEDSRFAEPAPVAASVGGPVLDLDADDDGGGFGNWGADAGDVDVQISPGGAAPATTIDIQNTPTVDIDVAVMPGGQVPDLPSLDVATAAASPSPARGAGSPKTSGGSPQSASPKPAAGAAPRGLVAADEGPRFKGRRKEQPQDRVSRQSNSSLYLLGLIVAGALVVGAYVLSTLLLK